MLRPLFALPLLACLAVLPACDGHQEPGVVQEAKLPFAWPPVLGQPYPNLALRDTKGETFQLSSLSGKVLLIEPVGMT